MKAMKTEELETKLERLREEKMRLTEAFLMGRIPQDIYRKTVIRIQKEVTNLSEEIQRRQNKDSSTS
jgi:hypothetical protein